MMSSERVSPFVAREQLLHCFTQENARRFAQQELALGLQTGPSSGMAGIEVMVRLAFQQVGGDFEHPSRATLAKVASLLAERSLGWGASEDLVFECYENIIRQIALVEDLPLSAM